MYLMIDNYDSFVYNLARYLQELGEQVVLVRNDRITAEEIERQMQDGRLEGLILSPGPKSPADCGNCREIVRKLAGRIPILGVCLGHQIIGHVFGAKIRKGVRPMHGKVTAITTEGTGLFAGLPRTYQVTRYHSLVVSEENFPSRLQIDARAEDGAVMAIRHRELPVYGIQFHPEAVLTEYGHALLENYIKICREWWRTDADNDQRAAVL
ncbi:MAG TPA: aminodeoxychorismate/anthranilate synthase component II [Candidatus Blautia gallistercoris]|uniref:Aminodeoxychorismate/anthranilate synthase component II n=1 Tax=Candidatus Blautia gallistercoris TaxID=2838490 RepID=A0A9D1WHH7_9FIRM|nr:aminodeoxychorismate/anthranilate synthase component II [Candidatus Blautia gallistercoris]